MHAPMTHGPMTRPTPRFGFVCLLAVACGGTTGVGTTTPTTPETPPIESVADESFPALYARTGGFGAGRPTRFRMTPDGSEVLFLRSGAEDNVRSLYSFSVETGEERVILTSEQVLNGGAEELSPEERALRERLRMTARGIAGYSLSGDGTLILVPLSGRLFVVTRASGEVRELASEGGYANDARFSPDATKVACVRGGELYVIDVASGRQRQLTDTSGDNLKNGLAEFVAQEEMSRYHGYWWSPDSRTLLYQETRTEDVERLYASNPIDPLQEPHGSPYPRAGTPNASVRLGLVPAAGGRTTWVEWDHQTRPYLASVRWSSAGPLSLVVQDRRQQHASVLVVDERSGSTLSVHEEEDAAWLNLDQTVPHWLDANRFLWSTERSGRWQLELRTVAEGASTGRMLTPPEVGYRSVLNVADDAVWVSGAPQPGVAHVFRVPLAEGEAPTAITTESGAHDASFGPDGLWVHTFYPEEGSPSWTLRRGPEETVGTLNSVAQAPPFRPTVQYLQVGQRQLNAAVIRPRNFVEGVHYPVLVSVYGGPGYVKVRHQEARWLREQWQADHGFIVVSVDGRGTPERGREWEREILRDVITAPMQDQIDGLRALAEVVPEMDLERVGIYGWSFGGYFSAMAVMRHPEVFRVGVAGAPVCDWRDYDTHYTERFMDLPDANENGYTSTSVLTYAPHLRRPLMIIHGTSDDNVYFVHALKMSDALLRAGAAHEFVVLAGSTHMVADPDVSRALQGRIMQFLADGLTP